MKESCDYSELQEVTKDCLTVKSHGTHHSDAWSEYRIFCNSF